MSRNVVNLSTESGGQNDSGRQMCSYAVYKEYEVTEDLCHVISYKTSGGCHQICLDICQCAVKILLIVSVRVYT